MDTTRRWDVDTLANVTSPDPAVPTGFSTVATVTFDTAGFAAGAWDLSLTTPVGGTAYLDPTTGDPLPISLIDGTKNVRALQDKACPRLCPEPCSGEQMLAISN